MARQNFIGLDGFVQKSRAVHGDYYDYSKSEYKDVKTKLIIICPKHGEFEQSPECHMKGYGCRKCAVEKRRQTMKERHGVEFSMQSEAILEKSRATREKKFGGQRPPGSGRKSMGLDEFLEKARTVHGMQYDYSHVEMKGYTVKTEIRCPLHGPFWQTPHKHLQGHGCPHPDCIQARKRQSNMDRFGVPYATQSSEIKAKIAQTNLERYGVLNVMQDVGVQAALKESVQAKYGVDCTLAAPEVREKIDATFQGKYGGKSPMCAQEAHDKARATMLANGGPEALLRPDMRGDGNPMHDRETVNKMIESKIANGTCHTSAAEEALYELLCDHFGSCDVIRQYKSDVYPYACDFYIPGRNMYIELNASWTHGGCWYNPSDDFCAEQLEKWIAGDTSYYTTAIHTWTKLDVAKRSVAQENHLNYIVFWDNELRDAELWFALGCPDGQDWDKAYSWMPEPDIKCPVQELKMTGTSQNLSKIAKQYQFDVFYAREMVLWNQNPRHKGTDLHTWLYHNRFKYLGKSPDRLSASEIMRGFTISGIMKGYTVFDVSLMDAVVLKYNIRSVYDPCSGWGERALYCKSHGDMPYLGVDVNQALFPEYQAMQQDLGMTNQQFVNHDSASVSLSGDYHAVITCPPYGDTEIYSLDGAENLSDDSFLEWWDMVVKNSLQVRPEYFCFQVNTRWRDDMLQIVLHHGFVLIDEMEYQTRLSSHFTRKNGRNTKVSKETMLVCRVI